MTEVVLRSNDNTRHLLSPNNNNNDNNNNHRDDSSSSIIVVEQEQEVEEVEIRERNNCGDADGLSLIALLLAVVRKSVLGCRTEVGEVAEKGSGGGEETAELRRRSMEIGFPTNVRHVAHVTFDRFHGFLGLPVEFEPEVPCRAPSASTTVFGVSTESMQCSYDRRGNSVPTILLLMQDRLYAQGGLKAEGIFRINAENSQEEYVRDQLNNGVVPDGIDVHCLAGLIKRIASGVLDALSPEQVMQCQSEDECGQLVKQLPQSEAALLDWAVNLMADVVQEEQLNKMNARNIALVFAPNMTQMADPLTALMYAVQVMNFLKMLIEKTLKERQEFMLESVQVLHPDSYDGHHSPQFQMESCCEEETELDLTTEEPVLDASHVTCEDAENDAAAEDSQNAHETGCSEAACNAREQIDMTSDEQETVVNSPKRGKATNKGKGGQSTNNKKGRRKGNGQSVSRGACSVEKVRGTSIVSRINSKVERVEAWR